jgi:molybdate transport system substrate-binding protein
MTLLFLSCKSAPPEPLRVAAASDLTEAFTELGPLFEKQSGRKVVFSFGSSGLLAKQIAEGAPFDVFAAANRGYVDETVNAHACNGATAKPYARGRLVAWSSVPLSSLEGLVDERVKRIAIANPQHAPYGRAAKEALQRSFLWDKVESRIVYAENVRQALQFAETGNVEVALVASANVAQRDAGLLIDDSLHQPIEQALVQCKPDGAKFIEFLETAEAKEVMKRYGFTLP